MAAGKREMVLAAMELAFERSPVAEELGLAILVQYVDIRLPEIFDGRRLRTIPLWDALLKEGLSEQALQVPFLALKSWEALFASLVELPGPLAQVDSEARARSTATLGFGSGDVAKLIADRAEQLSTSPEQLERQRMSELLRGVKAASAAKPVASAEAAPAGAMGLPGVLGAPGDRRIPLWAVGTMIAILAASGFYVHSYVREPPITKMDETELKTVLAVRDANQKGVYFVATVDDPNWATLSPADQYKRAKLLLDKLADGGVVDMTLLDNAGAVAVRLNVHEPLQVPESPPPPQPVVVTPSGPAGPPGAPAPGGAPTPAGGGEPAPPVPAPPVPAPPVVDPLAPR